MSNSPQQVINVGAAVNDGTGESLRNAFNAVNNNFANIWAAGPVNSQVVITNNVISTNETNLDLILAANGVGNIRVSSTFLPNVANVYDIGSSAAPFSEVHGQYFYGNGRFLTGIAGGNGGSGGTVYFSMAPPISPNVGDIWIESDTAVQYLYFNDDTSNQWAEMEAYISFNSGTGNGNINLTDIQSNVLPSVTNTYNLGSPSQQWKSLYISGNTLYIDSVPITVTNGNLQVNGSNVLTSNTPLSFANLTVTNNLTVANRATVGSIYTNNYYYANGVPFGQGGGNLGNSIITAKQNVLSVSTLNTPLILSGNGVANIVVQSTIIPDVDSNFDLGSTGNRFDSVYSRYYYGNGSFLTGVVTTANIGNWAFTGNTVYNINGGVINNSDLTHGATAFVSIPANGNTSPLAILNYYGNFSVTTATAPGDTKSWTFDTNGNITLPSNTANINYANGVNILNSVAPSTFQLSVYANTGARDSAIPSPSPGMMIYVTGTGMQVRGATQWNTIAGSGT